MSDKKELRVFISSTFRDLMPEREQLIKKTFPRIRAKCRERGVEFTEIDLRWGITDEESRTGKTIRICLEEIGRCPYFIGILGSRYGWVPGATELEKDPELLKLFPWLKEYSDLGKSIVEMEFAHGALHEKARTSLFYAQAQLREQPSEALLGLASRIQASALPYREFESPDELGEHVYNDLVALLDRDFPVQALTPLERERARHEAFALNRRRSYVPNPEYYEIFEQRVNSTGAPLIVCGESGLGKSALMAHLAHEYKRRHPEAFLVEHYIGSAEDTGSEDVIRHIAMEIKERYAPNDEIPSDDAQLLEAFPAWLAKVSGTMVLFIDALNQLTGVAPEMHWLPDFIPANIRLILSTTPDVPLAELRKRKWKELEMQPLTGQQVQTIAKQFLGQYRKQLDFAQLATLSLDEKTQRPLFLRTMLEELRVHGSHTSLSAQIEHYLASANEADLFQRVLVRLEEDHGADTVRSVMTVIWASRSGLSEHEIIRVTGLTRVRLSELLIAMEYHLMQREQLFAFFHNYLREAVEIRYLPTEEAKRTAHRTIAAYFAEREYSARRRDEEPWQWRAASAHAELKNALLDPQMIQLFAGSNKEYEYISHFSIVRDEVDLRSEFERVLATHPELAVAVCDLLTKMSAYSVVLDLSESRKKFSHEANDIELLFHNANAFYYLGKLREAATAYEEIEEYLKRENLLKTEWQINIFETLTAIAYQEQRLEDAERFAKEALDADDEKNLAKTLSLMQNRGAVLYAQRKFNESLSVYEGAIKLSRERLGYKNFETANILKNSAPAAFALDPKRSKEILLEALTIAIEVVGHVSELSANIHDNLTRIYSTEKDLFRTYQSHATAYRIRRKLLGEDHTDTLFSLLASGNNLFNLGHPRCGHRIASFALPKLEGLVSPNHPRLIEAKKGYDRLCEKYNLKSIGLV